MKLVPFPGLPEHYINADHIVGVMPFTSNDPQRADIKSVITMANDADVHSELTPYEFARELNSNWEE